MDSGPSVPSKVIHFRNVSQEISQSDITEACQPFGNVQQVVVLRSKNQALAQFSEIGSAIKMLAYHATTPCLIRGRAVIPQFSKNQELTGGASAAAGGNSSSGETPNRILLVTIQNPLYPITVDVLNQVFSPYGSLEKIVIFNKAAGLQALVQYALLDQAVQAKATLHGQNIYAGSCTLHIQYSNLNDLTVKANTDKTRDFRNPNLPTEAPPRERPVGLGSVIPTIPGMSPHMMQQLLQQQQQALALPGGLGMAGAISGTDKCVLLVSNLHPEADCDMLYRLFSAYGTVLRIKILHNKRDRALVQMADHLQATSAMMYLKGVSVLGLAVDINYSKYPYIASGPDPTGQDQNTKDYAPPGMQRLLRQGISS